MRTFIAIEVPEPVRLAVAALSQRLQARNVRASWVKPENMHLTLRFLGDIAEDDIEPLVERLAGGYANQTPFTLYVRGTGAFPNLKRPSVVWVGMGPVEGVLTEVHAVAEDAARSIGLPPDNKRFHPHLTLARIRVDRQAAPLAAAVEAEKEFDAGEFVVSSVVLFNSQLSPKGPTYTRLREFTFT